MVKMRALTLASLSLSRRASCIVHLAIRLAALMLELRAAVSCIFVTVEV
jgi:hypothetical protein